MYPRNIGRALGISVRVAGRIAGQRIAAAAQPAAAQTASTAPPSAPHVDINSVRAQSAVAASSPMTQAQPQARTAGRTAAQTSRGLSSGISGFLRPFRRIGGIVWLEVTGSFFFLFAAVFALRLWQNWSGISGISRDFAIGAAVVFLYLGVTSFWRARRR
jgi:hypothetical protein